MIAKTSAEVAAAAGRVRSRPATMLRAHLPVDLGARPSHTRAADRAGDDLGGRERVADVRGGEGYTVAAIASEPKPCGGRTSTTLVPSVLMIRQPPE